MTKSRDKNTLLNQLLDPTLSLSEFEKILLDDDLAFTKKSQDNYIFYYSIFTDNELAMLLRQFTEDTTGKLSVLIEHIRDSITSNFLEIIWKTSWDIIEDFEDSSKRKHLDEDKEVKILIKLLCKLEIERIHSKQLNSEMPTLYNAIAEFFPKRLLEIIPLPTQSAVDIAISLLSDTEETRNPLDDKYLMKLQILSMKQSLESAADQFEKWCQKHPLKQIDYKSKLKKFRKDIQEIDMTDDIDNAMEKIKKAIDNNLEASIVTKKVSKHSLSVYIIKSILDSEVLCDKLPLTSSFIEEAHMADQDRKINADIIKAFKKQLNDKPTSEKKSNIGLFHKLRNKLQEEQKSPSVVIHTQHAKKRNSQ